MTFSNLPDDINERKLLKINSVSELNPKVIFKKLS